MKKISKLLLFSAIVAGVFGVSSISNQDEKSVMQVDAANITQGTKLYLEPGVWTADSARFAAYFYGDGDGWISMTKNEGNPTYYEVTMNHAKSYTNVIFCRMNPGDQANGWSTKWNQTNDLVYDGTNNLYKITGWGGEKSPGTWAKYVEEVLPPLPTFTSTTEGIKNDKVRIWLDRSGEYDSGYTITMRINGVYYLPTGYQGAIHNGRWFCFYDMPKSVLAGKHVDLVVFLTDVKEEKVISAGTYVAGDNNKVWKIINSSSTYSLTKGGITDRIIPTFFAKVLEGYLTCSNSSENGYNAFPQIDANFLPRTGGVWNLEGNLDGNFITDYSGVGTGGYGSDRGVGVQIDAYAKYSKMQSMYNTGGAGATTIVPPNDSSSSNTAAAIIISVLFSFTVIGGLYFAKTRKKQLA